MDYKKGYVFDLMVVPERQHIKEDFANGKHHIK